ncbi:adenosylcobinamide-GDP ribazoletransferase [Paludibacterium paludis]|uniref:Adenosylcobinamide-GDP ribazoletransferase n=1 Tax=Paludibacterium paludis TaxID=1225769 RepID=A0A918NXY5_9NEIS|nr:adenosylcobinamide-GDP ribazoletransferase [Paludibacterium paludis]GGY05310.1 adenosylcobinamide-GDP ribazoletransferase [Paludibacterium paludis]
MTRLILAIQFLTRLPTPQLKEFKDEWLAEAARWFAPVGLLLGALVAGAGYLSARLDPALSAWVMLAVWVILTGALHLDGMADVADALGAAHRDKTRLLAVMKDPHLGVFGVVTLILQLSGKGVLLMLAARQNLWAGLVLIPAWSRLGILYWQTLPPLAPGMAERFAWKIPFAARRIELAALLAASLLLAPALVAAPLVAWLYRRWLTARLGGITGDCLGAGVEVMELALLGVLVTASFLPGIPLSFP